MGEARFSDQVVLITGAGGGLGSAAARAFASEGAKLVLADVDADALTTLADDMRHQTSVFAQVTDVSLPEDQAALHDRIDAVFGQLDVAVNNAGIAPPLAPLHKTSLADFDRVMAINLRGVFLGLQQQVQRMVPKRRGVILNIASAAGLIGAGHMAAYAAAKHGVVGLTRSAADETARHGIRVNALCPAFTQTSMVDDLTAELSREHGPKRATDRLTSRVPMRRVATPAEIVPSILWACDPLNSFLTGQAIALDGGLTAV